LQRLRGGKLSGVCRRPPEVNEENRINRICRKCGKRANLFLDEDYRATLCYDCSMMNVVTKTCKACGKVFQANPGHINNCGCG
jgi:hypothetical protein